MPSAGLARLSYSLLALALYSASSNGASIPQARRAVKGVGMQGSSSVYTNYMGDWSSASSSSTSDGTSLENFQDVIYFANVTIGGQTFVVQFDTGSSDLWVLPNPGQTISLTNSTNINVTDTYGVGQVSGLVNFANVELGGYTVPSQAFIQASVAEDFSFFGLGGQGILGMSFDDPDLSGINFGFQEAYGSDSTIGRSTINNIFAQNSDTPNSFDVALDRAGDLDETFTGTFLIGEHAEGYESVLKQPQLPRQGTGRWTVGLEGMNVNGQAVPLVASAQSFAKPGQLIALLDTGFTFPPLPPSLVDAIYSSIPGAALIPAAEANSTSFQWLIPCDKATNLTFTLGGVDYPVHPLDLTFVTAIVVPINGQNTNVTICTNTYQYSALGPGFGFDTALGDAFLRNVYASFDFGDPTDFSGNSSFVQLLSTTVLDEAWSEFDVSRAAALQQMPPTIDPTTLIQIIQSDTNSTDSSSGGSFAKGKGKGPSGAAAESSSTPSSAPSSDSSDQLLSLIDKYGPIVIGLLAGNVVIGLLLLIVALFACVKTVVRGGAKSRSVNPTYAPVRFKEAEAYGAGEGDSYRD